MPRGTLQKERTSIQPVLKAISAANYNKTVGQVMLHWLLQERSVVIPKTAVKKERMENLDVMILHFLTGTCVPLRLVH